MEDEHDIVLKNKYYVFYHIKGEFREENFNTAMSVLRDAGDAAKGDQRGRKGGFKSRYKELTFQE